MSALQVVKYVIAFAIVYFSFVVLQRHYTEKMTWTDAMKEGSKHIGIGIGLVLTVGSPVGIFILGIIAVFIILTLGDVL